MQESGQQGDINLAQELLNCPPEEERLRFLLEVLQSIVKSKGNPQVVYPILQQNLALLDDVTIDVLEDWLSNKFTQSQRDAQRSIAQYIFTFGNFLQQFPLGNKAVNMEFSLACYYQTLRVFTANNESRIWASIQNNLGIAYFQRIRGVRAENIELSIQYNKVSLEIYTKQDYPIEWARTQSNLGIAYFQRIRGDKAENIEYTVQHDRASLEIYTKQNYPIEWARTQCNVGIAYFQRIRGVRAENIELSIQYNKASLEIYTKQDYPIEWARTQCNVGIFYFQRIRGVRAENIELSIQYNKASLEIYTKQDYPIEWAQTQYNLGITYDERIEGDKAENIELSIQLFKSALGIYTRQDFPVEWAMSQNYLGTAYSNRIRGNKADNIEISIEYYKAALEIYTKQNFPIDWAQTHFHLGTTYKNRIKGDRSENIELSIHHHKFELEVINKTDSPIIWAAIYTNLGIAYNDRIKGDQSENIELSIESSKLALEIYTKRKFSVDWVRNQHNLGNAYINRIKGDKTNNIESSIEYYKFELEVIDRTNFPIEWAGIYASLGNAHKLRIKGDKSENIELSIEYFKLSLQVVTKQNSPIEWAKTYINLGVAYNYRIKGDKLENIELSIEYFKLSLQVVTKQNSPIEWAKTYIYLGIAYNNRIKGDKLENIELCIHCCKAALEIAKPKSLPIECMCSARNLGILYFHKGNWQKAIDTYEIAMQAAETSRSWSVNDHERQRILTEALSVYENAIQCAVNLKDYKRAIEYTERVRSRQLVELIASKDLYSDAQVPAEIQAYLAEYQQLNQEVDNLRDSGEDRSGTTKTLRTSQDFRKISEKIAKADERKQILYNQIRTYDPVLAGQIAVAPISHGEIQQLITNPHTAILTFYSTDDDTHIFILKHDREPELFTCKNQGKKELLQWLIANWRDPYQKNTAQWLTKMPAVLAEIATRLQLPQLIANHLGDIQELVLVPHLILHQIPFAALPILGSEQLLGEKFTIRCIPSCQILQYCQQRPPINANIQGIVEDADDSLMGARYEGQKIAEIYRVKDGDRLRGKTQATVANYRQLLGRVNRLHSSHHASFKPNKPLESALFLADGKITLGDLLLGERYQNLDEIFLSACETHVGEYTFTDDVTTITTGFLCIGARSVQSTLWSVDDLVTAIFDVFYHQERREGFNRAVSLKRAQVRLRYLSGEEFRINHYPELQQFLDKFLPSELDKLDQKIERLDIAKKTAIGDDEEEISREIKQLEIRYIYLETELKPILNDYCKQAYPFAAPFYWAGFICQGMA